MKEAAAIVAAVLFFVALTAVGVIGWIDCNDRGGDYVRGTFWYVCVDEDGQ